MDAVIRQTGMHLEYEPEWEGAFNLQLKQDDVIAEFLEWCGTDVCINKLYTVALNSFLRISSFCKKKAALSV